MDKPVLKDIKAVLCVISLFEARVSAFKKELDFFRARKAEISEKANIYTPPTAIRFPDDFDLAEECRNLEAKSLGFALKRLDHEVMFLCIEAYALHEGISKQKSLISKVIKQHGKQLSKVDKQPSFNQDNIIFTKIIEDDGEREFAAEEKKHLQGMANKLAFQKRKELRDSHGITSAKHEQIEAWLEHNLDRESINTLAGYRDDFAHRLSEFGKIRNELKISSPDSIEKRLSTVSKVLNFYKEKLQPILGYTHSIHYQGIRGFKYDSLSRLMQFRSNLS
jgi:hypothetical protein